MARNILGWIIMCSCLYLWITLRSPHRTQEESNNGTVCYLLTGIIPINYKIIKNHGMPFSGKSKWREITSVSTVRTRSSVQCMCMHGCVGACMCGCVRVFNGPGRAWRSRRMRDGGTAAHHFKGAAVGEQVGGSLGKVQGQLLCWNTYAAGQQGRGAGRSKGNLKITGHSQSVPLN